jgi:hypothetical protein
MPAGNKHATGRQCRQTDPGRRNQSQGIRASKRKVFNDEEMEVTGKIKHM